jgi:hypothetical protein
MTRPPPADGSHDLTPRQDPRREEKADRNLTDLRQERRVAQTGIQILFAFLLTLPFSTRFTVIQPRDRVVYVVTLIAAALATALLVAPAAYHRMGLRPKPQTRRRTRRIPDGHRRPRLPPGCDQRRGVRRPRRRRRRPARHHHRRIHVVRHLPGALIPQSRTWRYQ